MSSQVENNLDFGDTARLIAVCCHAIQGGIVESGQKWWELKDVEKV